MTEKNPSLPWATKVEDRLTAIESVLCKRLEKADAKDKGVADKAFDAAKAYTKAIIELGMSEKDKIENRTGWEDKELGVPLTLLDCPKCEQYATCRLDETPQDISKCPRYKTEPTQKAWKFEAVRHAFRCKEARERLAGEFLRLHGDLDKRNATLREQGRGFDYPVSSVVIAVFLAQKLEDLTEQVTRLTTEVSHFTTEPVV